MAIQAAAVPIVKFIWGTALSGLFGGGGRDRDSQSNAERLLVRIAQAQRGLGPISSAQAAAAPASGVKVGNVARGNVPDPLLTPPSVYQPPPSGPDWNPPPMPRGGTPPINPTGGYFPPFVGVFDPVQILGGLGRWNDILSGGIWGSVMGPRPIPKGPVDRAPVGRGDPWGPDAQAAARAQERAEARAERAAEREEIRRERAAERYEEQAGERRRARAMEGLENVPVYARRLPDRRPGESIAGLELELRRLRLPPAPAPRGNPWATYARAALPFLPLLSSLTQPGKGRSRRRDPLTQPQPEEVFGPGPTTSLTSSYFSGVSSAFGPPPGTVGTNTCECKAPRPKRRKRKRTVCYSGTYRERADGTRKMKKRKVPCK
jgi:hypothetical protein